jgi:16S rRNA (uracil1498-N3)-methyltransferase
MRRFFLPAAQIQQHRAILTGAEFHHLRHVLRLRTGDRLILYDERGGEHRGTISRLSPTSAEITITASSVAVSDGFSLVLAPGLLKGHKIDLVIEKATELGVSGIAPFFSTFTVARLAQENQPARLARWQRLAQSAAKQSGNPVPSILRPQSFRELLASVPDDAGKILLYEKERTQTLKAFARTQPCYSSLWVLIGPEGGFAIEEVEQARAAGFHIVGLGTSILRAETACIVAVALCRFLWGDENPPLLPLSQ